MVTYNAKYAGRLWPAIRQRQQEIKTADQVHAELLAREKILLAKTADLARQSEEFQHRLLNAVQMIASLLSSQSRSASADVAAQLTIAANRILAFGHVHRRLHLLNSRKSVEFKRFLQLLCADLSDLLFTDQMNQAIDIQGTELEISTTLGIPLGFIVSELVTNSVKHGNGNIKIRLQSISPALHTLSISDDGPGLPENYDTEDRKGLGMKIVLALVKQIGGDLQSLNGKDPFGATFVITFSCPEPSTGK